MVKLPGVSLTDSSSPVLQEDDQRTLKYLVAKGTSQESISAFNKDLKYLNAWCEYVNGYELPWPATDKLYFQFISHHLFDPQERQRDPSHGLSLELDERLVSQGVKHKIGPHSPSTVKRRISSWNTAHRVMGMDSPFGRNSKISMTLTKAIKASGYRPKPKSKNPLTIQDLNLMLETCANDGDLGIRDAAIMSVMFSSGGRRREEMANMRRENISREGEGVYLIGLDRTKTTDERDRICVAVSGRAGDYLQSWLKTSPFTTGPLFYRIRRGGHIPIDEPVALAPISINYIIKQRAMKAGVCNVQYDEAGHPVSVGLSAHGFRAGFMTECADNQVPIQEAMMHSLHRSISSAARYYQKREKLTSSALKLLD